MAQTKPLKLLTMGTFDILHGGHCNFLRQCERYADEIIIGVNSDDFVMKYRGRPAVYNESERLEQVRLLGYTAELNHSAGREMIERIKPNIIAVGSDWTRKDYYGQVDVTPDFMDENGITLIYIPYTKGISSTEIKRRLSGEA